MRPPDFGAEGRPKRARTRLALHGLVCGGGGSRTAERALSRVPGVISAYANPAEEIAHVEHEIDRCPVGALLEALRRAGFEARPLHTEIIAVSHASNHAEGPT